MGLTLAEWTDVAKIATPILTLISLLVSLILKRDVSNLRLALLFDKRMPNHIRSIDSVASELNQFLNDYDNNRGSIKTKLFECQPELEDAIPKLDFFQSWKLRMLVRRINNVKSSWLITDDELKIKEKNWNPKLFSMWGKKSKDDIWIIYNSLREVSVHLNNIVKNRQKSFKS